VSARLITVLELTAIDRHPPSCSTLLAKPSCGWAVGPMCAPEHHDHDQDAHNAPRVPSEHAQPSARPLGSSRGAQAPPFGNTAPTSWETDNDQDQGLDFARRRRAMSGGRLGRPRQRLPALGADRSSPPRRAMPPSRSDRTGRHGRRRRSQHR
jgi:hypothetical protein